MQHISVARAIASEFVLSIIKPIALVAGGIVAIAAIITLFLAIQLGPWWLLLFVPFGIFGIVAGIILSIAWFLIRTIRPHLSREQRQAVQQFVEKVNGLNEAARTPYPLLAGRVALDFLIHRDGRYVRRLIHDSQSIKGEYQAIKHYFDEPRTVK